MTKPNLFYRMGGLEGTGALMERLSYGLTQHNCETAGRTIFLPIGMENYNSRVIVSSKCFVCGKTEFEKQVDRTQAPTKGFYMTV